MSDFDTCIKGHEEKFNNWFGTVHPLLDQNKIEEAWKSYPFIHCGPPPFTPLKKPLNRSRVGLITTYNLFMEGQEPFKTV